MNNMKNYISILTMIIALTFGAVSGAWAQLTNDDIEIVIKPSDAAGTITRSVNARVVTLTVTPASGYFIRTSDFIVEKLVSPGNANARRRVGEITDVIKGKMYTNDMSKEITSVEAGSTAKYVFTIPDGYDGVYVTATFHLLTEDDVIRITANTSLGDTPDMTKHYVLVEDVSATVVEKLYSDTPFTGIFEGEPQADGSLPKISGLSHALFNTVNGGTVKNIVLDQLNIPSGTNVGGIANVITGISTKKTAIYNCGVLSGSVSGSGYVGSIVGQLGDASNNDNSYARVINCYSYANVSGGSDVGGIVGYNCFATTAANIRTMVMNCMFYGDITSGTNVSPVYGGLNINNLQGGLNTFNYYAYDKLKSTAISEGKYNCALAVEEKYLNRFEYYRLLLNSNKKLAAFYATGNVADAGKMAKWVLETADRTIDNPKPYPVLKAQGYYPSIVNYDVENAPDSITVGRNKGGVLPSPRRTLSVTISSSKTDGGQSWPTGASVNRTFLTLTRTDKDFEHFNYNYDKVQLPYYNEVGTGNYTGNRVVTGWKITAITAVDDDPYTKSNYDYTKTYNSDPTYFDYPNYNFADRKSSKKDLYTVSGRVFSQGAYFDVPYGVTSITIEPYWGKACYIADPNYDVVYKNDYTSKQDVTKTGTQVKVGTTLFDGQRIETTVANALTYINDNLEGYGSTVYDNAVVLVGNFHLANVPSGDDTPFTMMSVDEDNDHEPDYSLIYHHKNRTAIAPIRFDFLNIPGTAQAQKPNGASLICNFTIFKTKGWFEVTNTSSFYTSQLEYENQASLTKNDAPLILLGGVIDQFVSTQSSAVNGHTIYIHVGGNVWINSFGLGTHSDGSQSTPHVPVSVTGGEFPGFYLTGTYNANATVRDDNAECYISSGRFDEVAGASQEQIGKNTTTYGNIHWQIYNADITNFFGGGVNDDKPVKGNITTDIFNSYVDVFCGGPKFGNMATGKTVTTTAEGCTFRRYFGAGYGGNSYSRKKYYDQSGNPTWSTLEGYYTTDKGHYFDGKSTNSKQVGDGAADKYGKKGSGVATDFDYEFFVWSTGTTGARLFVKFVSFSLAQCNDVNSSLKSCIIKEDFYGGGNLGKVTGTATSVLEDCEVTGSVYGGGYSATLPTIQVRKSGFTKAPYFNSSSGMFEPGTYSETDEFTWKQVDSYPSEGGDGFDGTQVITTQNLHHDNLGSVRTSSITIMGTTTVAGDVYGGGALASMDTSGSAVVNLIGGTINGNVYGGGQGRLPGGKDANNHDLPEVAALVGSTSVNLNGVEYSTIEATRALYTSWGLESASTDAPYLVPDNNKGCVVKGSIFGCNNYNGTPKGTVKVHIYKTQNANASRITNPAEGEKTAKVKGRYDVAAVYGGGNLAAYEPTNALLPYTDANKSKVDDAYAEVIIDGCDRTSIQTVYGGGNAASTPATLVTVNGTFEIGELFGGGNGYGTITVNNVTKPNPGANVGFKDYSAVESTYDTKDKRQQDAFVNDYVYGSGKASVNIYGGTIHRVFGGSNTKGNVRQTAVTLLDENSGCDFCVDEAYGGGKSAPMDAEAKLLMACIPGLQAAYGGAEAAAIQGNVTLNITNGTFDRVFGGNNKSGTIRGAITVNIEETGCKPIIIGELYGGGNEAGYSVYGYKQMTEDDQLVWKPRESATDNTADGNYDNLTNPYRDPMVNVKSFTSIGTIYGGGYGSTAVMVGSPTVNINEVVGTPDDYPATGTDYDTKGFKGKTITLDKGKETEHTVQLPSHTKGKIGAINNVFGGGNAAKVIGNTNVNIGTLSTVDYVTKGSGESPRTDISVVGADIRGNVYGGGNNAEVTGNTNVTIGKKETTN